MHYICTDQSVYKNIMLKKAASAWRREIRSLWQNRLIRLACVVVSLVPLLYGALYLYAFWNPYGQIDRLPVAIINEDAGASLNQDQYNYGQSLIENLKETGTLDWQYVDRAKAEQGLNDRTYYAAVYIPNDFSNKILSVNTDNPEQAGLTYRARPATNYIASQITSRVMDALVAKLNVEIERGYFNSIFSTSHQSAQDLVTAGQGANTLASGLHDIETGSAQLTAGAKTASLGANDLKSGLTSLSAGANEAKDGSDRLLSGSETISSGLLSLTSGLQASQKGLGDLQTGLNGGLTAATGTISYLSAYQSAHPEVAADTTFQSALAAANQTKSILTLSASANQQLSSGATTLVAGSQQLSSGASDLYEGLYSLNGGLTTLASGLTTAKTGSSTLANGLNDIVTGTSSLGEALTQAQSGATTLSTKLSSGAQIALSSTEAAVVEKKLNVLSEPVTVDTTPVNEVPNYGTGLSPYFVPISLWVGALLMFFIVNIEQVRDNKDRIVWGRVLGKTMTLLGLGLVQALILGAVLQFGLKLSPLHPTMFYLFLILIAWSFTCILQLLIGFASDAGRFLGIILLVLQLVSAAGTFPIETAPAFLQWVHNWLPMTYAVNALREIISGGQLAVVGQASWILFGTALASIVLYVLLLPHRLRGATLAEVE